VHLGKGAHDPFTRGPVDRGRGLDRRVGLGEVIKEQVRSPGDRGVDGAVAAHQRRIGHGGGHAIVEFHLGAPSLTGDDALFGVEARELEQEPGRGDRGGVARVGWRKAHDGGGVGRLNGGAHGSDLAVG